MSDSAYSLVVSAAAWRQLSKLDAPTFHLVEQEFDLLLERLKAMNPTSTAPRDAEFGPFRIRYTLDSASLTVTVLALLTLPGPR